MLSAKRFHIYSQDHSFLLSNSIIICKIIVLIGLLITFFSDHWTINSNSPNIHASYKNRCSVHRCMGSDVDPVFLVNIACFLSIINFNIEFIIIIFIYCRTDKTIKIRIAMEGLICFLTFILTACLVIFGICISIYTYRLPMGYAYICFIISIVFSIIDWVCSIKQFISNWSETIYLTRNELSLCNSSASCIIYMNPVTSKVQRCTTSSSNWITINNTTV